MSLPVLQNPLGFSEEILASMAQSSAKLRRLNPTFPERVLRYLVDGDEETVLHELANPPKKKVFDYYSLELEKKAPFFFQLQQVDAGFLYRVIRFFSALNECIEFTTNKTLPFGPQDWLNPFLDLADESYGDQREIPWLTMELLEQALELAGQPSESLFQKAFLDPSLQYWELNFFERLNFIKGLDAACQKYASLVRAGLTQGDTKLILRGIQFFQKWNLPVEPFLEELVRLSVHSSKTVRESTLALLLKAPDQSVTLLEPMLQSKKASERNLAVLLLWNLKRAAILPLLKCHMEIETNANVLQTIEDVFQTSGALQATPPELELPPIPAVNPVAPLSTEVFQAFQEMAQNYNLVSTTYYEKHQIQLEQLGANPPPQIDLTRLSEFFQLLEQGEIRACVDETTLEKCKSQDFAYCEGLMLPYFRKVDEIAKPFLTFLNHPDIQLIHMVRFLALIGQVNPVTSDSLDWWALSWLFQVRNGFPQQLSLRETVAVIAALGLSPRQIIEQTFSVWGWERLGLNDAHADKIWPYFAENPETLVAAFEPQSRTDVMDFYQAKADREGAFNLLRIFPTPPKAVQPLLWDIALGEGKTERANAQFCLRNLPHKEKRIREGLKNRSAAIRSAAALWLADLNDRGSIPALQEAIKTEKNEVALGALLTALERLGEPLDHYLDRTKLLKEAQAGLKKGIPKDLAWFPFNVMPKVHWADSGQEIDPDILRWWIVQSYKLKTSEAGPILRRYVAMMRSNDRVNLGRFVFESWLGRDVTPIYTQQEAEAMARATVNKWTSPWYQQHPEEVEQGFRRLVREHLNRTVGAASEKGILAIPSTCSGGEIIPQVAQYLKEWGGTKFAQSKSLLAMISWMDDPLAIQLILSVANRFKTKALQADAEKYAQAIAERNHWTVDEMADRTIPTLGLNEQGRLELDYGNRLFFVTLEAEFNPILRNQSGEKLKSLPDPRKDDDETLAREAKKTLSELKKQLKSTVTLLQERLYEALCLRRTWKFGDWHRYLHNHPIMGKLVTRLIWIVESDKGSNLTFRPLEDGTLTDAEDNQVEVAPDNQVVLAHAAVLPLETVELWLQHCADYDVDLLFPQMSRKQFELPETLREETELKDFVGFLIESLKLRGKATALGYSRGEAEDGGWFTTYVKRFPGLKLEAVIEFTGNTLPEEPRTVALQTVFFQKLPEAGRQNSYFSQAKLKLGDIPPVLLCEVWNDARTIADQGTGFDPEWVKKSEY
ncbi:MAG: DUF4132 domain-containing protein [Blastocatellia bacterium]|nr:DUF4132 domain-containing protein [Blastocatellia bacterium]